MPTADRDSLPRQASWRDLLTREYLPRLAMLGPALWLHASNPMLTATTMPSATDEIGGHGLISWTFALYLAGSISVVASMSLLVARQGLRATMMQMALLFTAGCVVFALAPKMSVLLLGRVLQGLGGGERVDRQRPRHRRRWRARRDRGRGFLDVGRLRADRGARRAWRFVGGRLKTG